MAGKITRNDIALLSYIAEYKFLTVRQLAAITRRTIQVIRRRLRLIESENLVVLKERGFGKGPGRRENVIILTDNGIEFLRDRKILSNYAKYLTDKTPDSIFIDHDLLVSWFFIHLLQVERFNPQLVVNHLTVSSHNLKEGTPDKPLLQERFSKDETSKNIHIMIPDGVFTITQKGANKTLLFFLEVDMGTETLAKTKQAPGDVRQKIINYQTLFRSNHYKRYKKIFNAELNGFRLLFLTKTPARMKAICNLVQEMPPSNFIWVTDQERMFTHGVSSEIWAQGGKYNQQTKSILTQKFAFKAPVVDKIR